MMRLLIQRGPLRWILLAGGVALLVTALLVMEWKQSSDDIQAQGVFPTSSVRREMKSQASLVSDSSPPEALQSTPPGAGSDVIASSTPPPMQSTELEADPEPTPQPLPTPVVYANPESLGEVSEQDEEMYRRVIGQLAEKMSQVTDHPDSPAYREKFHQASEEADNNLRALMGNDAFLRMQSAASHGETAQ